MLSSWLDLLLVVFQLSASCSTAISTQTAYTSQFCNPLLFLSLYVFCATLLMVCMLQEKKTVFNAVELADSHQ